MDYQVWASLEGIPKQYEALFDIVVPSVGRHEGKLNLLAAEIVEAQRDDDLLLFIDGDAFIVGDLEPLCRLAAQSSSVVAIQRSENLGDLQPHPSFALMSVRTWRSLNGDWSAGYPWINETGQEVSDVGGNLLKAIRRREATWRPLLRSNVRDLHPLWFGVYGDVVYHHGAGFRSPISRLDMERMRVPANWSSGIKTQRITYKLARKMVAQRGKRLAEIMFVLMAIDIEKAVDFLRGESYMLNDGGFRRMLDYALSEFNKGCIALKKS